MNADPRSRPEFFCSAKCTSPVPFRHPALRTGLVAASLDPAVRSISYLATATVASREVVLDGVVLERRDGRRRFDVVPARPAREPDEEGLVGIALRDPGIAPLTVTAEDLRTEPISSNRRLVWSHRATWSSSIRGCRSSASSPTRSRSRSTACSRAVPA